MHQLLSLKNSVHAILYLKISSFRYPPPFLKHCSNLPRRFSITWRVIRSGIAAISSFILCFSSSMDLGSEIKTLLLSYLRQK
jgi:hypothetical protein